MENFTVYFRLKYFRKTVHTQYTIQIRNSKINYCYGYFSNNFVNRNSIFLLLFLSSRLFLGTITSIAVRLYYVGGGGNMSLITNHPKSAKKLSPASDTIYPDACLNFLHTTFL